MSLTLPKVFLARRREAPHLVQALTAKTPEAAREALNRGRGAIHASRKASLDATNKR